MSYVKISKHKNEMLSDLFEKCEDHRMKISEEEFDVPTRKFMFGFIDEVERHIKDWTSPGSGPETIKAQKIAHFGSDNPDPYDDVTEDRDGA